MTNAAARSEVVAGIGLRQAATPAALADAVGRAEAAAGLSATRLATVARKAAAPALVVFARAKGLKIVAVPDEALPADTPTRSPAVAARFRTGSVAEAAALAAAGPQGVLVARRVVSADRMATAAIAVTPAPAVVPAVVPAVLPGTAPPQSPPPAGDPA